MNTHVPDIIMLLKRIKEDSLLFIALILEKKTTLSGQLSKRESAEFLRW
jgi:hypothetical protein